MSNETSDLSARLRQIEESARASFGHLRQPVAEAVAEVQPEPIRAVPVPRRARVFLRHGEGHGEFSDVTLTSPVRAAQATPA